MKMLIVGLSLVATSAFADNTLLNKNGCMACHAIDSKLLGPAYKDVSVKYRGQNDAVDKLAKKIRAGGSGVWGQVPMPPHQHISEADAKKLAIYILSIK